MGIGEYCLMDKKLFRSLLLLITYAVVLVAVIVKLDEVTGWLGGVLAAFQPLVIGAVIAFILNRPCNFFARLYERALPAKARNAARPLAAATAYLIVAALITALVALVVPELTHSIEMFMGNLNTYAANFQDLFDWVVTKLDLEQLANLDLSSGISESLQKLLNGALDALTNTLPHLIGMTSVLISAVVTGVISLVFSIYMLSGAPRLTAQCRRLIQAYLPRRAADTVLSVTRLTADTFSKYVNGQMVEACILGGLCFLGMCVFRFDYAPLISVAVGVFALIPIAGAYLGAVLAVLLLVMIDPWQAVWFLVFLVALQQLEGNLIYPRVVGTSMGLPGIWVLAAVTVGGSLLGLVGMVVSVPLAAVAYTLLKRDLRERLAPKSGEDPAGQTPPEAPAP
ncbi:MAG: AI-2E family transporter [Oscillospiraceae bacterium]|nr:AI-2E family transporter [Oscillospiraceae bacterium]